MFRRRMIMSLSKSERLPNQYQEVEYIESTGTQRIDTGILYNSSSTYEIDADLCFTKLNTTQLTGWNAGGAFGIMNNQFSHGSSSSGNPELNVFYNIKFEIGLTNSILSCEDVGISISRTHPSLSSYAGTTGYPIFCQASRGNYDSYLYIKLKSMSIKLNNILVRDFVPCYRKSDVQAGLYDLVEGKFYENVGTGIFSYPVDFEKEYGIIEYIQSTGTEKIDINIKPNNNTRVVSEFELIEIPANGLIFGPNFVWNGPTFVLAIRSSKFYWGSYEQTWYNTQFTSVVNMKYKVDCYRNTIYINDEKIFDEEYTEKTYNAPTIKIFGSPNGFYTKLKLYSFKIYENNTLKANFVPCYRKIDGVAGLYDLCGSICPLTGTPFYINNGTGTFLKGDDV